MGRVQFVASLLQLALPVLCTAVRAGTVPAITYYVASPASAPGGAPTNTSAGRVAADGSADRPFHSLKAARDAVRTALRANRACGVEVVLGEGVYTEQIQLGALDSGSAGAPVVWRAAPGQHVLVSGGLSIPRSAFTPWNEGPAGAVQANLTQLGLTDLGSFSEGGGDTSAADSTGVAELFFENQPMDMARWPNLFANGSVQWAYTGSGVPHNCTTACTGFTWKNAPPNADKWPEEIRTRQPYLHGYWTWDWRDGYTPLTGVDTSAGVVAVSDPSLLPKVGLGARWHTINMLCELDSFGEYYIARNSSDTGMLYFLPPLEQPGLDANVSGRHSLDSAFVSVAPHVLSIEAGTSFVTLEGISFAHARGTIITTSGPVSNITIKDCTVSNGGGAGINMTGTGILISDTEVFGLAATGVEIRGGHHKSLTRGDNVIRGNYIHS
jgi:hypothetical protein